MSSLQVGLQVRHQTGGQKGIIRYIGEIPELAGATGTKNQQKQFWAGVEWKEPKGKNDGSVVGPASKSSEQQQQQQTRKYHFRCEANHGSFVRLISTMKVREDTVKENDNDEKNDSTHHSNLLLPEKSLYQVLMERFGPDDVDDEDEKDNKNSQQQQITRQKQKQQSPVSSPFYQCPDSGAFKNCISVDCHASIELQVVSSAGGTNLTTFFPNLKTLSCSGVLLNSWVEALSIPALLPNLETFNISDNDFCQEDFPALPLVNENNDTGVALRRFTSTSLRSFNCSHISPSSDKSGFSFEYFWWFLLFYPNLKEIFLCHNSQNNDRKDAASCSSASCSVDYDEIPPLRSDDYHHRHHDQIIQTLLNLEHIALAHNNFRNLDSLLKPFVMYHPFRRQQQQQIQDEKKTLLCASSKLQVLNVSSNRGLEQVFTKDFEEKELLVFSTSPSPVSQQQQLPLFPNLSQLLIRDTGFRTTKNLLQFFDSRLVFTGNDSDDENKNSSPRSSSTITDVSLSGIRLLHPERETDALDPIISTSTCVTSSSTSNNIIVDPLIRCLLAIDHYSIEQERKQQRQQQNITTNEDHDEDLHDTSYHHHHHSLSINNIFLRAAVNNSENTVSTSDSTNNNHQPLKNIIIDENNSDRRKIMIALLPPSVLRINNTSVERTNWFGDMKKGISATRPIRSEALRWIVIRIFQGLELIMAKNRNQSNNDNGDDNSDIKNNKRCLLSEEFLSGFPQHLQDLLKKEEQERELQNHQDATSTTLVAAIVAPTPKFIQHEIKMKVISIFPNSPGELLSDEQYLQSFFAPTILNLSQKDKMIPEMTVDVRWNVQELEEKLVKEVLKLNFEPHQAELYKSVDTWAVLDVEIAKWRYHLQQQQHTKNTPSSNSADRQRSVHHYQNQMKQCEKLWSWCFPKSKSVSLYYVDHEMLMVSEGAARQRGMFLKPLWRTQATLFSFGKFSDGDMILVVVN